MQVFFFWSAALSYCKDACENTIRYALGNTADEERGADDGPATAVETGEHLLPMEDKKSR